MMSVHFPKLLDKEKLLLLSAEKCIISGDNVRCLYELQCLYELHK